MMVTDRVSQIPRFVFFSPDRLINHLNQVELSRRWKLSPRTLERWRWLGQAPRYLKVGGRVVYRLEDIEEYEAEQIHEAEAR